MQQINNYGSVLQAYSLQKEIKRLGHNVSFLKIKKSESEKELIQGKTKFFSNEHKYDKSFANKLVNMDETSILRGIYKSLLKKYQKKVIDLFRLKKLQTSKKNHFFDVCVIGSDEVFNCLQNTPWGYTSQLFGNVENANKVFTYAASCGSATYEELPDTIKTSIKNAMLQLKAVSVRDSGTEYFVKKMYSGEVFFHLDPVAIGDFSEELEKCRRNFKGNYCLVYSYNNRISNESIIKTIKEYCKINGLDLVSVFGIQKWIKKHWVLKPIEVIKAFSNADCVITDTFHGVVISSKYAKRFGVIIQDSNKNKITDYVQRIAISNHVIESEKDITRVMDLTVDRTGIDKKLMIERERTINYLKQMISV